MSCLLKTGYSIALFLNSIRTMSQERLVQLRFPKPPTHRFFIRVVVRCALAAGYHFIAPESIKPFNVTLRKDSQCPKKFDFVRLSSEEMEGVDFSLFGSYTLEVGELPTDCGDEPDSPPEWRWTLDKPLRGNPHFEWAQFWFHPLFFTGKIPFQPEVDSEYWHYVISEAREYYFMRCLFRVLQAKRLHSRLNITSRATHANYIFRRNSRRSKIIPAFEDYCREVGFACVDDLDSPVVRVPDFVPSRPVFAAIGSVDDSAY